MLNIAVGPSKVVCAGNVDCLTPINAAAGTALNTYMLANPPIAIPAGTVI